MVEQSASLLQSKVLALECFLAEVNLANLIFDWVAKYNLTMNMDEVFKAKDLVNQVKDILRKLEASDDFLQGNASDKDFTEPKKKFYIHGFLPTVTKR